MYREQKKMEGNERLERLIPPLLKAQNQALTDRTDFHEDVLTEIILAINP